MRTSAKMKLFFYNLHQKDKRKIFVVSRAPPRACLESAPVSIALQREFKLEFFQKPGAALSAYHRASLIFTTKWSFLYMNIFFGNVTQTFIKHLKGEDDHCTP